MFSSSGEKMTTSLKKHFSSMTNIVEVVKIVWILIQVISFGIYLKLILSLIGTTHFHDLYYYVVLLVDSCFYQTEFLLVSYNVHNDFTHKIWLTKTLCQICINCKYSDVYRVKKKL